VGGGGGLHCRTGCLVTGCEGYDQGRGNGEEGSRGQMGSVEGGGIAGQGKGKGMLQATDC
jgi:hypothetical protein